MIKASQKFLNLKKKCSRVFSEHGERGEIMSLDKLNMLLIYTSHETFTQ